MASPPTLPVEDLLLPIADDSPSGESLVYEPEYDRLREARRADEALEQGDWKRELKVADWDRVVKLGTDYLAGRTKDLQIAAWLTEALVHLHGFAGLRDGLLVMKGIQERYWETFHPQVEAGDLEDRLGPFLFLNNPSKGLPFLIRSVPVARKADDGPLSYLQYRESRETDNLIKREPAKEKQILASGRLTAKQFDEAAAQTPKRFYADLVGDLKEAQAAFEAFDRDAGDRFGRLAPNLLDVAQAIEDCLRLLEPILAAKRLADPDPEPEPEVAPIPAADEVPTNPDDAGPSRPADPAAARNGVSVPTRRARLGTPQEGEAADYGRILIDFRDRAQALAEAGAKLAENRQKYHELLDELKRLDDEYEELSLVVSRNHDAYGLLARLLASR